MHLLKYLCLCALMMLLVIGCGPSLNQLQKSVMACSEGKYNQSESVLKDYVQQSKIATDKNYSLLLLTLADTQFRQGNYRKALTTYNAALKNMTAELTTLKSGTEYLKQKTNTLWRGKGTDQVFIHYRMGICYFMVADYDNARIEFSQALLADLGADAAQKGDIVSVHFFQGLCYSRLKDDNEAAVSFRKVTELKPDFPFGWYELALISDRTADPTTADSAWKKYEALVPENQRLARADTARCVLVVADLNSTVFTKKSVYEDQLRPGLRTGETRINLSLSQQPSGNAVQADDVLYQFKTEGGKVEGFIKDATGVVAREAIRQMVPLGGLFVGGQEVSDFRVWYTLPGSIYLAMIPAAPGEYSLALNFSGPKSARKPNGPQMEMPALQQTWYYITPQPHNQVNPVYVVSCNHLHNLNVDHLSVSLAK